MTDPFTTLTAIAAPLPMANVDTDKILPARFLKTVHRTGLGKALFATLRADPAFVLNRAPWNCAGILIAGDNFGCGSSREHAPWALLDFGIRCIIAPSIADIFYNNCFKNGILPIALSSALVDGLMQRASNPATAMLSIDLDRREIIAGDEAIQFSVDDKSRRDLLNGTDEISETLALDGSISSYEADAAVQRAWLRPIERVEF